jgi:hypothetical protein
MYEEKQFTYRSCSVVSFVRAAGMCVSRLSSSSLKHEKHETLQKQKTELYGAESCAGS